MLWIKLLIYLLGLHSESIATVKPVDNSHEVIEQVEDMLDLYIPTYEI